MGILINDDCCEYGVFKEYWFALVAENISAAKHVGAASAWLRVEETRLIVAQASVETD